MTQVKKWKLENLSNSQINSLIESLKNHSASLIKYYKMQDEETIIHHFDFVSFTLNIVQENEQISLIAQIHEANSALFTTIEKTLLKVN